MKRLVLVVLVGLLAVFFFAGMAFAQWQGGQGGPRMGCQERFDALDTNHDGKLTMEEFMAARIAGEKPKRGSRQWMSTGMVI